MLLIPLLIFLILSLLVGLYLVWERRRKTRRAMSEGFDQTSAFRGQPQDMYGTGEPSPGATPPDCVPRRILNKSEGVLLAKVEAFLSDNAPNVRISPQVSYGAFLQTKDRQRWREVANKRSDFVLWTTAGDVLGVLEFDGGGHWGRTEDDAQRVIKGDRMKNHACVSAGIPLIRIQQRYKDEELQKALRYILRIDP